ncbi:calcium-activated potassium channel slowpoke-like [Paramacrobiotus metropolitanus]|uniref:calcium-activated potassium channel slowpoke-like n=1 Tax=Paramacrobiotus metropolitanus TaxID=2943436 RepID=UPI0024461EC8|nr:calcium-activated potassium channel slowpoke-like [Paramacrobiotus metropolitanus]
MQSMDKVANYNAPCVVLGKPRLWWIFLLSSILTPFILAFFVLVFRFTRYFAYKRRMEGMAKTSIVINREQRYGPKVTSWRVGEVWRWFKNMQMVEDNIVVLLIRNFADHVVNPRYFAGKLMLLLEFCFSMGSLFIYYQDVSTSKIVDVEICRPFMRNVSQQVDFAFNCFFLFHFIMRFWASEEKIIMIFDLYSIIDYFTVPPAFVGLILDRRWVGLRFLRVIYLRKVSTLLAALRILKSPPHIKLLQLGLTWIAILLAAGGFFHLLDASGDFFFTDYNGQRVSYWEYCYFAFTTMSTIGGSETNPKTILAKLCNCILVFIVLAVICFAIPDVKDMMGSRKKWAGEHRAVHNERHIVVCGDVSFDSVYSLFMELFHPDRDVHDIKIICLDEREPDLEFTRFLKRNTWRIGYLQGSVLELEDLRRAKLHEADACMILANKTAADIDAEDSSNIMCVVAVKNYHPKVRVIMQLLQYRSKTYLTSIPNWDPMGGDDVICLPEIKLGLIAQSCIAPGFSTLLSNMFAARSGESGRSCPEYMENYLAGAGMEMYTERLSNSFLNLPFIKAVEICCERLHILLFAVSIETAGNELSQVIVNPHPSYVIRTGASGCFVADSAQQVQRVLYYCSMCHADVADPDAIKPCQCEHIQTKERAGSKKLSVDDHRRGSKLYKRRGTRIGKRLVPNGLTKNIAAEKAYGSERLEDAETSMTNYNLGIVYVDDEDEPIIDEEAPVVSSSSELEFSSFEEKIVYYMRNFGSLEHWERARNTSHTPDASKEELSQLMEYSEEPRFDSTGMFWWCPPRAFTSEVINRFEAAQLNFHNHVVIIVFADEDSTLMGLNNLIMPLRCSNVPYDALPHVVILGNPKFLIHEWPAIINFPKITVVKIHHLSRADLRAVNIDQCRQCVLLSAALSRGHDDMLLADIDPILTTLTIKAMPFGDSSLPSQLAETAPIFKANKSTGQPSPYRSRASSNYLLAKDQMAANQSALRNRRSLAPSNSDLPNNHPLGNPRSPSNLNRSSFEVPVNFRGVEHGWSIPILTELVHDSNVQFVDQEDDDINDFFMAEPFVCGQAFTTSVLQALMVSTFFNPYTLSIIRSLIFGGVTPELEQILAEGTGLIGGPHLSQVNPHPDRCRVDQISLEDYRFARHMRGTYGDLFFDALRNYSMICLGLYRRIQPEGTGPRSARRYVITNPPIDFPLVRDDKVFVIARLRWS